MPDGEELELLELVFDDKSIADKDSKLIIHRRSPRLCRFTHEVESLAEGELLTWELDFPMWVIGFNNLTVGVVSSASSEPVVLNARFYWEFTPEYGWLDGRVLRIPGMNKWASRGSYFFNNSMIGKPLV